MRRRDFIATTAAGAMGIGVAGYAGSRKSVVLKTEVAPFIPRPAGMMPMRELGKTGIKISQFGFGSHIRPDMVKFYKEREYLIHEAYDLGINLFDVYDLELNCFQYEPMGRMLKPFINDVVISMTILPYQKRTVDEEIERDLRLFGREYIDMVRHHASDPNDATWEKLFKYKEKGYIRAIGYPIHDIESLDTILNSLPIDFVLFPHNFYHNICWIAEKPDTFENLPDRLRKKGVGVATMKVFAGDWLAKPFTEVARRFTPNPELVFPGAAVRYVLNSGFDPDTVLIGMYNLHELYLNVKAFYEPAMSDDERKLLDNMREYAPLTAQANLPPHYKWLEKWAGKTKREAGQT